MWPRIKRPATPLSVKLTILYAVILFCILIVTSLITVAGTYFMVFIKADNHFERGLDSVTQYLAAGNAADERLLEKNLLPIGVVLRIVDDRNNVLVSSPSVPDILDPSQEHPWDIITFFVAPFNNRTQIIRIGQDFFYYTGQAATVAGRSYQLHLLKPMDEQIRFLACLVEILAQTSILGLLIAVVSGVFISRRILRPLRDITNTAREIEVNDLGKRIEVTGSNDELEELAKTFNHMLNRIQTGFERQCRFVADASHELRTPVTVISGYANMLDRWGKEDPAVLEEGIGAIKAEAANMYELIEKLLFLARADYGRQLVEKAAVEMAPLIDEIAQETRLIAPNHVISLEQNDPVTVYADGSSIKEMLRIFIENSIKYTPIGKTISIASQRIGGHLEIIVQDNGVGIPKEDLPYIFDRFYRVDKSRTRAAGGGTGLGLAIARWIADQHFSTIDLTSKPGDGTKVTVRMPLLSSTEPEIAPL